VRRADNSVDTSSALGFELISAIDCPSFVWNTRLLFAHTDVPAKAWPGSFGRPLNSKLKNLTSVEADGGAKLIRFTQATNGITV
jgi:hypothetical protein